MENKITKNTFQTANEFLAKFPSSPTSTQDESPLGNMDLSLYLTHHLIVRRQ
jgi:hypothetical protein